MKMEICNENIEKYYSKQYKNIKQKVINLLSSINIEYLCVYGNECNCKQETNHILSMYFLVDLCRRSECDNQWNKVLSVSRNARNCYKQ